MVDVLKGTFLARDGMKGTFLPGDARKVPFIPRPRSRSSRESVKATLTETKSLNVAFTDLRGGRQVGLWPLRLWPLRPLLPWEPSCFTKAAALAVPAWCSARARARRSARPASGGGSSSEIARA